MTEQSAGAWGATALDVKRRLAALRGTGETAAVATVVGVQGSAYRRPGAKMVLEPDGDQLGGITAGCLEGPVAELSRTVFDEGTSVVRTFDMTDDDEWGLGLGCNGVIDVLVEPVDDAWDAVIDALDRENAVATVTAVGGDGALGARAVVREDGAVATPGDRPTLSGAAVDAVRGVAADCLESGSTARRTVETDGGEVDLFVDGVRPPEKLLLFGGQPDTRQVARMGRQVGFEVTVATGRGALADPDRFPDAHEVVSTNPDDLADLVDDRTAVVLMSHNLLDDELALASVLDTAAPYVGLMGPRKRFEKIREDLLADGVPIDEGLDRVATPVGLDLGGGEPVEIALSIVSEVLAALNGREGGRLTDREGPIHGEREPLPED